MMIRKLLWTTAIGCALSLGACDKGDAAKDGKAAAKGKAGDAKGKTADTKGKGKAGDAKVADAKAADTKAADDADAAEDKLDDRVVKAAELAKKIEADPSKADAILEEAGMDRTALDALMYEVSQPDLAEQYRLARAQQGA
ncbi:MAG: hypothetical protein K0V04_23530 [Deltaproteobacteria bacterium]|nr:hypothetical protein [Deltaproteobacteria bacterium]